MRNKDKAIYIKIRSECIKQNEDTVNGGKFINEFSIQKAEEVAQSDLEIDLLHNELRITLDELLLYSVSDCILIAKNRMGARRQKIVNEFLKNAA